MENQFIIETQQLYYYNISVIDDFFKLFENKSINTSELFSSLTPQQDILPSGHTESTIIVIVVYCILFAIAAIGNLSVVITLSRSKRHRRSRISLMICHLAVADLMVAFFMIPVEIGWRIAIEWYAGNVACKAFTFIRAFCLYLSSNVLVCVSLDRCFAVVYPLRLSDAKKRGKIMLASAWTLAIISSIPQSIIFHVAHPPGIPDFHQCVTFGSFDTDKLEAAYNFFCVLALYFVPLIIICIAYTMIVCEITNRSHISKRRDDFNEKGYKTMRLRCNTPTQMEKTRQRTFKLTITIVLVFIWCWTPYVVMTLWYVFDRESAAKVDNTIQDGLFLMAVSNSCMNPLIYGSFASKCKYPCIRQRSKKNLYDDITKLQRKSTSKSILK